MLSFRFQNHACQIYAYNFQDKKALKTYENAYNYNLDKKVHIGTDIIPKIE